MATSPKATQGLVLVDQKGGRVVAFNNAEKWSQDVSEDIAREIRRRCDLQASSSIQDFVELHEGRDARQLTLRLVEPTGLRSRDTGPKLSATRLRAPSSSCPKSYAVR